MSWDSLFAYSQMRNGVTSSAYPPVMSYVWAVTDFFIPGQGGAFILQVMVTFLSLAAVLLYLKLGQSLSIALILVFSASAIIAGPMLVIWKDVGMSAFLLAGVSVALVAVNGGRAWVLVVAGVLMAIGASYRLNSLPAVVPLAGILALGWSAIRGERIRWLVWSLRTAVLVVVIASGALLSVSYRLPDFRPLPLSFNSNWTAVYDLLGMSVCLEQNLVPSQFFLKPPSQADIKRVYRPEHIQLSFDMMQRQDPSLLQLSGLARTHEAMPKLWKQAVLEHPLCYLRHRAQLLKYMLGANSGGVFYLTHNGVDENEFGLSMQATPLTHRVLSYIAASGAPGWGLHHLLARTWFFLLIATVGLGYLIVTRNRLLVLAGLIYASGGLYLAGNVFVLPAADARYQHWAVICFFLVAACALAGVRSHRFAGETGAGGDRVSVRHPGE